MKPVGVAFAEINLDSTPMERNLKRMNEVLTDGTIKVENAYKSLGLKSDQVFNMMKANATAAVEFIKNKTLSSTEEIMRAQAAAAVKINSINQSLMSNDYWKTLGVRSTEAIKSQMNLIKEAATSQQSIYTKGSQDWINIERAKNTKLKELNKEMVGEHEMSMASMTRALLRFYAAYYVVSQAATLLVVPFKKGFEAVESYNQSVASLAAMVVTFSELKLGQSLSDQWKSALAYSIAIVPVLEQIAARTLLSGQETTALANAFARSGVFLRANNTAQIEGFTRISNALPLMTKGQEIMRQINTEIRSVMTGQNEQSSMMLQTLKALPGFSKENLELWRQQGTVLENVGKLLEGFGPATALLENQWQAVKSTLDTTVTQVLRGGMLGAYGELILSAKDLDEWLKKNKDSLIDGMSKWIGNFLLTMYTIKAEVLRLAMLLDKIGGTMSSAQMLLYGPGKALGIESSTKRFESAADRNINYENRYKETEKELEKLAIRYNNLEQSISSAGLAAAKLARSGSGGNEEFKAKPGVDKEAEKAAKKAEAARESATERIIEATRKASYEVESIGQSQYEKDIVRIDAEAEKYRALGVSKVLIDKYVAAEKELAERKGYEVIAKASRAAEKEAERLMEQEIARGVKLSEEHLRGAAEYEKIMASENAFATDGHEQSMNRIIEKEKEKYAIIQDLQDKGFISFKQAEEAKAKIVENTTKERTKLASEAFYKENDDRQQSMSSMAQSFDQMAQLYAEDSRERQALSAASKAATVAEIALQVEKNLMIAIGAVVNQGTGDPYTAFARIAAMVAVVAGVLQIGGIAFGGGSSGAVASSSATWSNSNSTVLGAENDTASESITKSWELMQDTYNMEFKELSGIYNEMKDLNDNITGLVTSVIRTGGVSGISIETGTSSGYGASLWSNFDKWLAAGFMRGTPYGENMAKFAELDVVGTWVNQQIGKLFGSIFGGGTESWVSGTGISTDGSSIKDLLSGGSIGSQAYTSVTEKHDGGWFSSDWYSGYTFYDVLNENVSTMLDKVFRNMGETIVSLAEGLGTDVTAAMNYAFAGGFINLQGMDSDQINTALTDYFSALGDTAVEALFGTMLKGYQEVGEGLMETASRILIDKAYIVDTLEMTNQAFIGTTSELIAFSEAMIEMAGDLDTLRTNAETYYDKFFSDAEKQTRLQGQLSDAMEAMNLVLPDTREGYRAVVEALDLTSTSGMQAYVTMLSLSESADEYYSALEDSNESLEDFVDNLKSITETIDEWLDNLAISDLAPVSSAAEWNRQYSEAKAKASMSGATEADVSDYLSFATKYLEFQKSYGTATSYQAIYDAVVADVTGINTDTVTALDIAKQQLEELQSIAVSTDLGAQASLAAIAAMIALATQQAAIDSTAGQATTTTPTVTDNSAVLAADLASRQAAWYANLPFRSQGMIQQDLYSQEYLDYINNNPFPLYASGGYADTPSIFGETGGEYAVPTYEPQRSKFLKTVGADPETLGTAIGRYLQSSNGGTSSSDSVIDNHIYIDGKEICRVVTKGMKTDLDLINTTRKAVN
jgi:hypothetical protein